MAHTVIYNPDLGIIEVTVKGDFTLDDVIQIYRKGAELAAQHDCYRTFSNYAEATIRLTTIEIYDLPKTFAAIFGEQGTLAHRVRRALVIDPDTDSFQFFETVTLNRGQSTRLFFDVDEALAWLLAK